MKAIIHNPCDKCELCKVTYTVGQNGFGNPSGPLKIFLDSPNKEDSMRHRLVSRQFQFLRYLLNRLSLETHTYYVDFAIKCFIPEGIATKKAERLEIIKACSPFRFANLQTTKSILTMGEVSALAFSGKKLSDVSHSDTQPREFKLMKHRIKLFCTYAPGAALQDPAEVVAISRMIYRAAKTAGLKPKVDLNVKPFDWEII